MPSTVFHCGDEPFLRWMVDNPEGYVLNAASGDTSTYLMFHRSGCAHISTKTSMHWAGAFTTRGFIKICSLDPQDLIEWAARNRSAASDYKVCRTCSPEIGGVIVPVADEVSPTEVPLREGAVRTVLVNAYERNPNARRKCLAHYGCTCVVCGFCFEDVYGEFARGYIHVHHLVPIAEIGESYEVDPLKDLRPVCPNCHAALHLGGRTRTIQELRALLECKRQDEKGRE